MKRCIHSIVAFCLLLEMLVLPLPAFSQTSNTANVQTGNGLHIVTFSVPQGKIKVFMPDDMAAGDSISGTVSTEPKGSTDAEKAQNKGVLNGHVIDLGDGVKVPADTPRFTWTPQVPQSLIASRYLIRTVEIVAPNGKHISSVNIPIPSTPGTIPSNFTLPQIGQTGRHITISGPFDGNAANTGCTIGGEPAAVIAESPRKIVVRSPSTVTGLAEIKVNEGNTQAAGQFRSIGVNLSAPKTNLAKGEKTVLTVQVSGLQGISDEVPLQMITTGTVNVQGGNDQNIQIQPNQVNPNGNFNQNFDLTGTQAGNFNVTATALQACNLKDQIVHVESNHGGRPGDWIIGIKTQNGTTGWVHIGTQEKPKLKFCDWIKIKKCHADEEGLIWIDDYEMAADPTPKPPPTTPKPKPPTTPDKTPPSSTGTTGGDTTTPPPCKEGAIRNRSVETKVFELIDDDSEISMKVFTDKQGAADAAQNMADYFKTLGTIGGLLKKLFPKGAGGVGAGGTAAGLLLKYLEGGGDILDGLAKGKLKNLGVGSVTAEFYVSTKKITAVCISYEICVNGKWVPKKEYSETAERSSIRASKKAEKGDSEWEKVSDPSRPQSLDPDRAEKWAKDFFKDQANILKKNGKEYEDFKKNCK